MCVLGGGGGSQLDKYRNTGHIDKPRRYINDLCSSFQPRLVWFPNNGNNDCETNVYNGLRTGNGSAKPAPALYLLIGSQNNTNLKPIQTIETGL